MPLTCTTLVTSITISKSPAGAEREQEEEETMFSNTFRPLCWLSSVNPSVMIPSGNSDYFVNWNTVLAIKWPESLDLKQNSHLEDEEHLDKVIELFTYKALLETRDCKQKS